MKNLFENFRKRMNILLEKSIHNNANALDTMPVKGYDGPETAKVKFDLEDMDIANIVRNVKPLTTNEIVKAAGAGRYGITYVLDNDHILKLFFSTTGGDDLKKYKEIQDRQFSGTSHKGEPAIYDFGEAVFHRTRPPVKYVEMGKVISMDDWIKINQQDYHKWEELITRIDNYFSWLSIKKLAPENSRKFIAFFQDYLANKNPKLLTELPTKTVISLLTGIYKHILKSGIPGDFHLGNFGVIPSNNSKEPDIFVFFDV